MKVENPLFLLDYDGTLAPIAPRPEEAFPHPEALEVLGALMARYPLYVVTGRRVADFAGTRSREQAPPRRRTARARLRRAGRRGMLHPRQPGGPHDPT
ncbi:MAG: trehalose-phosphatase, partial [Thermus sp.]